MVISVPPMAGEIQADATDGSEPQDGVVDAPSVEPVLASGPVASAPHKVWEAYMVSQLILHAAASQGDGGALSAAPTGLYGEEHYYSPYATATASLGFNCQGGSDDMCLDTLSATYAGGAYFLDTGSFEVSSDPGSTKPSVTVDETEADQTAMVYAPLGDYSLRQTLVLRTLHGSEGYQFTDEVLAVTVGGGATYYRSSSTNKYLGEFATITPGAHASLYWKPYAYGSLTVDGFASFEREQAVDDENTNYALDTYGGSLKIWTKIFPQAPMFMDTPDRSQQLRSWFPSNPTEKRIQLYHQLSVSLSRSHSGSDVYGESSGWFVDVLSEPTLSLQNTSILGRIAYHYGQYQSDYGLSSTGSLEYGISLKQALDAHWFLQVIEKRDQLLGSNSNGQPTGAWQVDNQFYVLVGGNWFASKYK